MSVHTQVDSKKVEELIKESLSLNLTRGQMTVEVDALDVVSYIKELLEEENGETEAEFE